MIKLPKGGTEKAESSVVSITASDGGQGTGFFISPTIIVTCAHVAPTNKVSVLRADKKKSPGIVISRVPDATTESTWPHPDLALIEVEAADSSEHFLDLAAPDRQLGRKLATCGYTRAGDVGTSLTWEEPDFVAADPVLGGRALKLANCMITSGMSGGPVFSLDTGEVVGVLKRSRSTASDAGGWSIPVGLLDSHFPSWLEEVRKGRAGRLQNIYARRILSRTGTVEPRGMRRSAQTQDIVFPLIDVFCELEIRNYSESDLMVHEQALRESPATISDQPYLGFDALVERLQASNQPRTPETGPVSLEDLVNGGLHAVLLGDPGSGKSTVLQWLAMRYSRAILQGLEAVNLGIEGSSSDSEALTPSRVPVLIRAGAYSDKIAAGSEPIRATDLFRIVSSEQFPNEPELVEPIAEYLMDCWEHHNVILLVDGLDEVADLSARRSLRDLLEYLVTDVHTLGSQDVARQDNKIIASSRHAGYAQAPMGRRFRHVAVQPLSDQAAMAFLVQWSYAIRRFGDRTAALEPESLLVEARLRAGDIQAALAAGRGMDALARTPLMLTVITLVYSETGRLPTQRVSLLSEMSRILIERRTTLYSFPDACDLLSPFAVWLHDNRASGVATAAEFRNVVNAHADRIEISPTNRNALTANFCASAQEQYGLIVERGPGLYAFQHRLFQEFFVACEMLNSEVGPYEALRPHLFDPVWREVVLLTAGLVAHGGRGETVQFLLAILLQVPDDAGVDSSASAAALLLVADCLGEIERNLPQVAQVTLSAIVDVCLVADLGVGSMIDRVVLERLPALANRYPSVFDQIVSAQYMARDHSRQMNLCNLVARLGLVTPTLAVALEQRSLEHALALPELRALAASGQSCVDPEIMKSSKPVPAVLSTYTYMARFGPSDALATLGQAIVESEDVAAAAERLQGLPCTSAQEQLLIAIALGRLSENFGASSLRTLLDIGAMEASADYIVEMADLGRLASLDLEELWERLPRRNRDHVLTSLGRTRADAARSLVWAELRLSAAEAPSGPESESPNQQRGIKALLVLAQGSVELSAADALLATAAVANTRDGLCLLERVLAKSALAPGEILSAEIFQNEILAPEKRQLLTAWVATRMMDSRVDEVVLRELLELALTYNGLWRMAAIRRLRQDRVLSDIAPEAWFLMLQINGHDASDWATEPVSRVHASWYLVQLLLRGVRIEPLDSILGMCTQYSPEVLPLLSLGTFSADSLSDMYAGVCGDATHVFSADAYSRILLDVAKRGHADLPALRSVQLRMPGGIDLLGYILAIRHSQGWPLSEVQNTYQAVSVPDRARVLNDYALWLAGSGSQEVVDEARAWIHALDAGSTVETLVADIRLGGLRNHADISAFASARGAARSRVIKALVTAGADSVPWSPGDPRGGSAASRCLDLLLVDVDGLTADSALIDPLVLEVRILMQATESIDADGVWPQLRFLLECLVMLAQKSPETFSAAARAFGLNAYLRQLLSFRPSFGVRVRAFRLLCYFGVLTEEMVTALSEIIFEDASVVSDAFVELGAIRQVESAALRHLDSALQAGGRVTVMAVDLSRQLSKSAAFLGDAPMRHQLLRMLARGFQSNAAYDECVLASGANVNIRTVVSEAWNEVVVGTYTGSSGRWLTLSLPPQARADTVGPGQDGRDVFASGTFSHIFLARVQQMLEKGKVP